MAAPNKNESYINIHLMQYKYVLFLWSLLFQTFSKSLHILSFDKNMHKTF